MWTCLLCAYFLFLPVKSSENYCSIDDPLLCGVQPIQDSFSRLFNSFEDFTKVKNVAELAEFYENKLGLAISRSIFISRERVKTLFDDGSGRILRVFP